ncbi:hypothetical protein E2C01_033554 [Portunus trituberculatus]|uniref:Uncharacterized protein n=1 Tax=Portunus trituberculatus TaxID=210409 RepID=A0A5B7EY78_PORTR|nr:hypothetical protein [Portunus trituberculatus]
MAPKLDGAPTRGPWRRRAARHIVLATCCFHSPCAVSPCFVKAFLISQTTSNDERVSKLRIRVLSRLFMSSRSVAHRNDEILARVHEGWPENMAAYQAKLSGLYL